MEETDPAGAATAAARRRLVETVARVLAAPGTGLGGAAPDPRVLDALAAVPRELFVPRGSRDRAYRDEAMPIEGGQTISQPSVVALMTQLLDLSPADRVLEVGAGSGYQTAVLARLCGHVYAVEAVPELADAARRRLDLLGIGNVTLRTGDGRRGWPDEAPFDACLAACAARRVPQALVDQLRPGGRLVLPVGPVLGPQQLCLLRRERDGRVSERPVLPVLFVPMVGG
ncbi:MAG TPA: protein-L-isoaspartate(D-aspartate) O-methyltransferase [Azospirillaceae bacterium]|nr:protein-L-isoaspartate(D-aspartate) O-methyltransferase [Azospirillaceae bacterium]